MSHASVLALSEAALRNALKDVAREMMRVLAELNTRDGVFLKDQGRQLVALDSQLADLLRARAVVPVISSLRSNLSLVLDATLAEHRSLGKYRPEITSDLASVAAVNFSEVARAIADNGHDLIFAAIQRATAGGAPVTAAAGPLAEALEVTRMQAVTAIQRAIREVHEGTLKRMGENQETEFVYVYVGPPETSPNIRPYCAARTGKALTQKAADALDPRERFNCRHSLAPLPRYLVEEEGLEIYEQ